MSLWKLRVGVESYYLAQVASGLDEYYTGSGEAAGRWSGAGAPLLGLTGEVAGDDLRAVLAGLAPGTGLTPNGTQLQTHPRRVPGFDLTFSVPKSVSVVWALGDPLVQAAVVEACEAALAEALAWLEREACFVRRGSNSERTKGDPTATGTRRMVAEGFVAAQFPHRTSRLGDPHLHWHVLVANTARGIDGRWTALDGQALYRSQRTVGVLFQHAMRRELTERLGVEWGPSRRDAAEIAGVPARVLREFSQRSEQIAEWLDHHGKSGAAARTEALLDTRTSKQIPTDFAVVEAQWRDRAERIGWSSADLEALLGRHSQAASAEHEWSVPTPDRPGNHPVGFDQWVDWLLTTRVTEKSGTFTRFDLTQAVADVLPSGMGVVGVERVVDQVLASSEVVQVGDHWAQRTPVHAPNRTVHDDRELLYTSRSLLATERRLVDQLAAGVGTGTGVLDQLGVEVHVTGSTLGDDQAVAIRSLTSSGDRVAVMVGRAGTGKTHTLGTLGAAYEAAGWSVIGLAPSARAARELQDGSGIGSTTIARHLVEQRDVSATTVVVVDEAAMAGTRDVAAIVDQATAAGAKVVLVGDHHQLPEVAAGGAFRAALDTLGDRVVELTVNRRQRHEWERAALDQLRCGNVETAFAAYRDHGRVVLTDTSDDLHAIVLGDWHTARTDSDTLLLAGTRAEARLLNRYARQMLATAGELSLDDEIEFAGRTFTVGDQIVMCRNDRHQHLTTGETYAVDNGMRGTITDLSPNHMTVQTTNGDDVVIDRDYLDHGWVDHAYAVTIHKAQGVTCDSVLVVGPAGLYREGAYVALSRARDNARLYVTTADAHDITERHERGIRLPTEHKPDPEADLLARLHQSAAKNLVIIDDPHADVVAYLATTTPAPDLLARARHARDVEHTHASLNPTAQRTAVTITTEARTHLATGRRVRAIDRDNVGHVLDIDDHAGTCLIHFATADGRSATKTLDWSELVVIDHPDRVELTDAAAATLDRRLAELATAEAAWRTTLAEHGIEPDDAEIYRRALHAVADTATHALRADPPEWLTTWIGTRPTTPATAAVWDDATTRIAHHRLLHDIPAHVAGIGTQPTDGAAVAEWRDAMLRTLEDRLWLEDHRTPDVTPLRVASPTELAERHAELRQLVATAPADQQQFIDRITTSQLDAAEMHDYLAAALAVQDDRRTWILASWPHLIELQQVTALIEQQPPMAHWPTTISPAVQEVLDQLRALAPQLDAREGRTLAELDHLETEPDPVRRLEARRDSLERVAQRATEIESAAVRTELAAIRAELREARRARAEDAVMNRYVTNDTDRARATRVATLLVDALEEPPHWLLAHLSAASTSDLLSSRDVQELTTRITRALATLDAGRPLPADWFTAPDVPTPVRPDVAVSGR